MYGADRVFSGISLEAQDGAHIGIVGANGSGKTSLLRVIAGELEPSEGQVYRAKHARVGYVQQNPSMATRGSLRDEILSAFDHVRALEEELAAGAHAVEQAPPEEQATAQARYASLLDQYEALGTPDYENVVERTAAGLGLTSQTLDTPADAASGGERTRAALARALLAEPDLLLLDEPTNHLDLQGLAWLERFLATYRGAFIVVSHDRYFLDKVVTHVWEMERGKLSSFPGNYTKYRALKDERTLRRQREYERQQTYIAKEEAFIQRYRAGQRAREARGRATRLARLERLDVPRQLDTVAMPTISAGRTTQVVLTTKGLKVGVPTAVGPRELLNAPDLRVQRGERIAIIGENGAGKTTLLRTLMGLEQPLAGSSAFGAGVSVGYYRQGLEDLPGETTVLEAFLQAAEMSLGEARSYLARFLFQGDDVFREVRQCSGGERSRLTLARLLVAQPNMLIMDEPTNHLDIPGREALEEVLQGYDGTLLFVSHDRRFISLLAESLWVTRGGVVEVFKGSYEEWALRESETARRREAEAKAPRPARPPRPPEPKRERPPRPFVPQPKVDHERVIAELETRVSDVEHRLQQAAERKDVAEVARLGREHSEAQGALERAWAAWRDGE